MADYKETFSQIDILILEDSKRDFELIKEQLFVAGFDMHISHVDNKPDFTEALQSKNFDIIISDFKLPGFDAFGALELCNKICPDTPFICVSGSIGEEKAIELLKIGAVDYVLKDRPERLPFALERALNEAREKQTRKMAEEKIKILSQAIEQSPVSVMITSSQGDIEYVNPKFLDVTGYTLEETIQKNPRILKSGNQDAIFYNNLWVTITSGNTWRGEFLNKKKNGEFFWESATISPVKNENGEIKHYLAVKEDITDQKLALQKLVDSEKYYRSILKTIPDPLFILDNYGCVIDYIADKKDLFYAPEVFIGKKLSDTLPEIETKHYEKVIQQAVETGELIEFPYSLSKKGKKYHFIGRLFAFGSDKIIAISTDITERVNNHLKIESLLEETNEQNARLRNFTQIVSHNLRSHTSNMLGVLKILELKRPQLFKDETIGMIHSAANSLNQTMAHLNEVLNINLTNQDKWTILNLKTTIDVALSSLKLLAQQERVELINEIDENAQLKSVPAYLESIALNLVSNGIRFRSRDRKSFVRISSEISRGYTMLKFEDNGLGIDLDRHKGKLFGMYKAFHSHKDSKGLGLFLTKTQVEAIRGKIEVESQIDKGTVFKIFLPYHEENQKTLSY
ncbi:MAG: PAS domain S-box protein [Cyclobacteriaceae bacterium]|nr:PAS domain S-box protein [Cyclobacteriaceae bacterium]